MMISIKKRSRKSILNDVEVPEPGESSKKRCLKKPTTSTAPAADTKEALFDELDHWILKKGLTELHTHLLGMGSADFWVTRIIESYLPRAANALGNDVEYPLETILEASGFSKACDPIDLSVFEAMFFDSSESETLCSAFREVQINDNERKVCISNNKLVELLHAEDKVASLRGGSLRALVRNWFEFLGSNGNSAHHSEILKSYRGNFTPQFYPQRFQMKDPIIDAFPSVLGILLNTTCYRYAKAGVQYIEYSVSSGDLVLPPRDGTVKDADLRWEKFHAMKNEAFSQPYSTGKKVKTPEQEHALELKKRSEAMLRLAKLGLFNINNFPELQVASSLRRNLRAAFSRAEKEREAAMESTAESGPPDEEEEGDDGDYDDASEDDTETSDTEDEDEDDYSVLSTALAGPPVLPTILGEGRMKFRPAWRAHINYFEKPTNQSYHFLAAFNRNSKVVFHKIEQGEWTSITIGDDATAGASASSSAASEKKEAKKFTPREATMWLGDLCSNLPELLAFLKKNEEILKAADGDEDLPDLNISSDKDNFQELCKSGRICDYLKLLAQILCQDKFLSTMYPQLLPVFNSNGSEDVADGAARAFGAATSSTGTRSSIRSNTGATTASTTATTSAGTPSKAPELKVTALQSAEHMRRLHPLLVGLDWVGDEMGHPFCVFSHDAFISLVVKWKKLNPKFGLRFHAGEGPIRPSSRDPPDSTVRLAFYLHMYILVESIRLCHAKLTKAIQDDTEICDKGIKANIRIGHGVAFLFGCNDPADNANVVPLVPYLKEFRTFLKENDIVCELNPTSNHMLLSSTFSSNENPKNERTLRMFLRERVPVVLGTDDDGIWAIHKCRRHHHHVSVAAEFCQAIECGDIQTSEELQSLIQWGRKSAFSARSKSEEKKYSKID